MKLTGFDPLNTERNNAGFCNTVVSIVHRTVAKFHACEVNIYFVMCFESTFPKRNVKPCLTWRFEIDPFTTENLGTLSTDFMNKKYGKWNVFN